MHSIGATPFPLWISRNVFLRAGTFFGISSISELSQRAERSLKSGDCGADPDGGRAHGKYCDVRFTPADAILPNAGRSDAPPPSSRSALSPASPAETCAPRWRARQARGVDQMLDAGDVPRVQRLGDRALLPVTADSFSKKSSTSSTWNEPAAMPTARTRRAP